MSRILTIELTEIVYAQVEQRALAAGAQPEQWLANALAGQYGATDQRGDALSPAEAIARFRAHFGELDVPPGLDNESIDPDLARAYGDTNEPQ